MRATVADERDTSRSGGCVGDCNSTQRGEGVSGIVTQAASVHSMTSGLRRFGALVCALVLAALAGATSVSACACCSHTAARYVAVEKLGPQRMAEIERMDFARTAKLMTTEADT